MTRRLLGGSRRHQASILLALMALVAASLIYLHPVGDHFVSSSANQHPVLVSGQFAGADFGWLLLRDPASSAYELVATSDSGRSWHRLALPPDTSKDVLGFQLIDPSHATLQLGHGLQVTQDGGSTWREVALPDGANPGTGVDFLDQTHGWYLSGSRTNGLAGASSMWSTADGGTTWTRLWSVGSGGGASHGVPLDGNKVLLGFATPRDGWMDVVSIASSRLLVTHDGGANWKRSPLPLEAPVVAARFLPPRTVLLVLEGTPGYVVITSRDASATWGVPRQVPVAGSNFGTHALPAFLSPDTWLLPAGHQLVETRNQGQTWITLTPEIPSGLQLEDLLWVSPAGHAYGAARDSVDNPYIVLTSDSGRHWSPVLIPQLS
jgi:hypothetical protein